jgi:hypothetical protein
MNDQLCFVKASASAKVKPSDKFIERLSIRLRALEEGK